MSKRPRQPSKATKVPVPASKPQGKPRPPDPATPPSPPPVLTEFDLFLLGEGTHLALYDKLGAQPQASGGVHFAVWAPNAQHVSVIGAWNDWDPFRNPLIKDHASGVWHGHIAEAAPGMLYKYRVIGVHGEVLDKADPCAHACEAPPETASRIVELDYAWNDAAWLAERASRQALGAPISVYELHLGSWLRGPAGEWLNYRDIAEPLIAHVQRLGLTHVEFLPITEHPFYGSWGYQTCAYFAPSARYGSPQDLMALIDQLHQAGIGVLLDWVPAHFPADAHGLARFDGTCLYEHEDPRRGVHPDWRTLIFNLGRHEVRAFILSSAMMWLERYHFDGLRVDAVASMLYLDYSRREGEWLANGHGGRENLESVAFLRAFNTAVHSRHPGTLTIAEESTAWPLVSGPVELGGLGFDRKWDMGWMHDSLRYLGRDPVTRSYHHRELTFRMWYAYTERFMLPLSHDEVVHGKGTLLAKAHGNLAHKLAHLRLLYTYMFTTPGNKLLFMGCEHGPVREWNHDAAIDWSLRSKPGHRGLEAWLARVAHLYRDHNALHELDFDPAGFEWLVVDDNARSVAIYLRLPSEGPVILVALNFTPVAWQDLPVGVPCPGTFTLLARSDACEYTDLPTPRPLPDAVTATQAPAHGHPCSITLTLPPLGALLYLGPDAAVVRAAIARGASDDLARETAAAAAAAVPDEVA